MTASALYLCFALFHLLLLRKCFGSPESDRIAELERKVKDLETALNDLEPLFVARYGLTRHCLPPIVAHGEAKCDSKLSPGSECTLICDAGYIETPGKSAATCREGGVWSSELQCEVPLVLISGGSEESDESDMELLSFYPSTGCDISLSEPPFVDGKPRSLHNLLYVPPQNVLACNGMSGENVATCEQLNITSNTWKHHSKPNKGSAAFDALCDIDSSVMSYRCKLNPEKGKGRYAAEALYIDDQIIVAGGMVYDGHGHEPTNTVRHHDIDGLGSYWAKVGGGPMEKKRAFFCSAKVKNNGFLAIGGLGHDGKSNVVEQSVELIRTDRSTEPSLKADMSLPRSGHGCTEIPNKKSSVLVSGGTTGFGHNALVYSEVFDWARNSWETVAEMRKGRFGHALVAVGEKVFAIGGDEKNPRNLLDTIEEYDIQRNMWKTVSKKLKKPRANFGFTLIPHSMFKGCVLNKPLNE